jgi:hypothetical protein
MIQYLQEPPNFPPEIAELVSSLRRLHDALLSPPDLPSRDLSAWQEQAIRETEPIRQELARLTELYQSPLRIISGTPEEMDRWLKSVGVRLEEPSIERPTSES